MSGKIGLVLSGGGAKGAYEVGVYKALSEMGVLPYIDTMAGTSVGALNAALLESRGAEHAQAIWSNLKITDLLNPDTERMPLMQLPYGSQTEPESSYLPDASFSNPFDIPFFDNFDMPFSDAFDMPSSNPIGRGVSNLLNPFGKNIINPLNPFGRTSANPVDTAISNGANLLRTLKNGKDIVKFIREGLPFNLNKVADLIDNHVDFNRIRRKIYVICTDAVATPKSFILNQHFPPTQKKIILASATLPVVYTGTDGVEINGINYFDGGVAGDVSNTPVGCLYDNGCRNIIAVHLKREYNMANQYHMSDANIINIFPSRSLGNFLTGTLNLNSAKVQADMELGYRDTAEYRNAIADMVYNL